MYCCDQDFFKGLDYFEWHFQSIIHLFYCFVFLLNGSFQNSILVPRGMTVNERIRNEINKIPGLLLWCKHNYITQQYEVLFFLFYINRLFHSFSDCLQVSIGMHKVFPSCQYLTTFFYIICLHYSCINNGSHFVIWHIIWCWCTCILFAVFFYLRTLFGSCFPPECM